MRLTAAMFSCIFILIGAMIFQSTHAARDIFTINNSPPNSDGAFGAVFISQQEREEQNSGGGNSVFKTFNLQTPISYFNNSGRGANELNKIYVS